MEKKKFLEEIDLFRGIAIFLIVLCHMYIWMGGHAIPAVWANPAVNRYAYLLGYEDFLICGGTSFFVFISGFLLYYVFYQRGFSYKNFILSKLKNVFSPYLVMVAILALWRVPAASHVNSSFWVYGVFLYHAFWYIPFIMCVFLASPLYIKFIESKKSVAIGIFALMAVYSCCTARQNGNPIFSMLFWSSFYLLGILTARFYEEIKSWSDNTKWSLVIACVILVTVGLGINISHRVLLDRTTWDYSLVLNFAALPKLLYCLVILFFCQYFVKAQFGGWIKSVLHFFAKYSFSIYFLHVFIIYYIELHTQELVAWLRPMPGWKLQLLAFSVSLSVCTVCAGVALLVKKVTGKYSRSIVGS